MRILTIRQPWAELIIRGRKNVENRSWPTRYRGPIAIHAGMGFDQHEPRIRGQLDFGAIIGVVQLVECAQRSGSPWGLRGQWHWLLEDPQRLITPIQCRGRLGLGILDPTIERRIMRPLGSLDAPKRRHRLLPVVRRLPS